MLAYGGIEDSVIEVQTFLHCAGRRKGIDQEYSADVIGLRRWRERSKSLSC